MKLYMAIGIGGMIGAVVRYETSLLIGESHGFPYATFIVNMLGCFLLSYLLNQNKIKNKLSPELFSALSIGMIGSFTTFSTITIETLELWHSNILVAISYVLLTTLGGLLFCYVGYKLATRKLANP